MSTLNGSVALRLSRRATARALATVWQWVRELTGETRYDRYVEHQRQAHPDQPVASCAEFWRAEYAAQGNNPGSRCC